MAALPGAGAAMAELPLVRTALQRRDRWPNRQAAFDHWRAKKVFGRLGDAALRDVVDHAVVPAADGQGVVLAYSARWEARIYATPPVDVWETLPRVTRPTLALRAADSDTLLPPQWALWHEKQPAATFEEVAETGHLLPFEAPQRLGEIILDWLGA
jgi:pimeloyl-ACP methyl ester carboxylesterase